MSFISLGTNVVVNIDHIKAVIKNEDGTSRVYIDLEDGCRFLDSFQSYEMLMAFLKVQGNKPNNSTINVLSPALNTIAKSAFTPVP